jgi:hypothetical protein
MVDREDDFEGITRRAFVPVWSGGGPRRKQVDLSHLGEPGRGWLEWSILFSAVALLFPEAGIVALVTACLAARARSPRGLSVTLAAVWCLLLGLGARQYLGLPLLP